MQEQGSVPTQGLSFRSRTLFATYPCIPKRTIQPWLLEPPRKENSKSNGRQPQLPQYGMHVASAGESGCRQKIQRKQALQAKRQPGLLDPNDWQLITWTSSILLYGNAGNVGEVPPNNHKSFPSKQKALLTWTFSISLLGSSQLHYLGDILEDFGWIGGWKCKFSSPIFLVKFQYVKVVIFNVFL